MLTTNEIQDAIRRAGYRARRRIHDGELDPYRGEVGKLMTQCVLMAEVEAALHKAMVAAAGLPAGSTLTPVWTPEGTALAVTRPINGRAVR